MHADRTETDPRARRRFPGGSLDPELNALQIGDQHHRLEPRQADVLAYLLRRAQVDSSHVVSKDELIEVVWQGRHVSDDALVAVVYQLRRALGDRARDPRFIETIAKRGYRWIALPVTADHAPVEVVRPKRATSWAALAAAAVAIVAMAGLWRPGSTSTAPSAPDLLLDQARTLIDSRTSDALRRAREIIGWRLDSAPDDAHAWALESRAQTFMAERDVAGRPAHVDRARAAADRALTLAPNAADALLARGLVALIHEHDRPRARQLLGTATRSSPQNLEVAQAVAWWQSIEGRHAHAIATARTVVAREPDRPVLWTDLAYLAWAAGDHAGAARAASMALDLDPNQETAPTIRLWSRHAAGETKDAVDQFLEGLAARGVESTYLDDLRSRFEDGGWQAFYTRLISFLPPDVSPIDEAIVALYDRDRPRALERLEVASERGDPSILWLEAVPDFAPLRDAPRFRALRAAAGHDDRRGARPDVWGWPDANADSSPAPWWRRLMTTLRS